MSGRQWQETFASWGLGGWPEGEALRNWRRLSAVLNADRIHTPLLDHAADSEYLLGLALVGSLEQLGKPVELFIYPNELHVKNQPRHRYEIYERNVDWFRFWLQDVEDPDPANANQYLRWRELRKAHVADGRKRQGRPPSIEPRELARLLRRGRSSGRFTNGA